MYECAVSEAVEAGGWPEGERWYETRKGKLYQTNSFWKKTDTAFVRTVLDCEIR